MINKHIEDDKIDHAINNNILEFQECLPTKIRRVCVQQYEQNEKNIHRR